jgi:hypothetical protein
MATDHPTDRGQSDSGTPAAEDAVAEGAVLAFLLDEYPRKLTIPELSLAMNRGPDDFAENDAIERAVRELVGAGLLHHHGTFVLPTRAALYREALVMD